MESSGKSQPYWGCGLMLRNPLMGGPKPLEPLRLSEQLQGMEDLAANEFTEGFLEALCAQSLREVSRP